MKRLIWVIVTVIMTDLIVGAILSALYTRVTTGDTSGGVVNAATQEAHKADVLLLGSSTAHHDFDSGRMSRLLGVNVYNAGSDGMGYDFVYGLTRLITKKGPVSGVWVLSLDLGKLADDTRTAWRLAPRMDEDPVVRKLVLDAAGGIEGLMYLSRTTRYNGKALSIVKELISPQVSVKGFLPLYGVMPLKNVIPASPDLTSQQVTPNAYQVHMIRSVAEIAKHEGTKLLLVAPPLYGLNDKKTRLLARMNRALAAELGLDFRDYTNAFEDPVLFKDAMHLNAEGAARFSTLVSKDIAVMMSR